MIRTTDDRNESIKTKEKPAGEPALCLPGGVDVTLSFADLGFYAQLGTKVLS